jgi:hypothetical protein
MPVIPVLLVILVALLLGLVAWGFLQIQSDKPEETLLRTHNTLLAGLGILVVCVLRVFLIYLVATID